ncbi:MAG: hypothetical protein RIS76_759 [Verrucomicrobiota bacterium]|jgi:hypothetical protein
MTAFVGTSFLRSLILHGAAALPLGASEFLTFDANQKRLAEGT